MPSLIRNRRRLNGLSTASFATSANSLHVQGSEFADQPLQGLLRSELPEGVGQQALDLHAATQKYSVTSGYGLFRRMTGVGPVRNFDVFLCVF